MTRATATPRAIATPVPIAARRRDLIALAALAPLALPAAASVSAEGVLVRVERAIGAPAALRFDATGTGSTFGQAFEPGGRWPRLEITQFARTYDYAAGAMREESARRRAEPNGGGAVPLIGQGEQRITGFVNGEFSWNQVGPAPVAAPVALDTRRHDLWTSPHGWVRAARRNQATVSFRTVGGRPMAVVSFSEPGVMRAEVFVDGDDLPVRIESTLPHPVTGDTRVVTEYGAWREHGALRFPATIRQSHFGQPTLELAVSKVDTAPATGFAVPDLVRAFGERVASTQVAPGVWFLAGGSHNSVLIEMRDHLIVVEAPLYDGRSLAVLAEARRLVPGKPVRTVINSHHHFDHSGGLRAAASEGAQLMVTAAAKPWFDRTFATANAIKPDALAKSRRRVVTVGYSGTTSLDDGSRRVDVHAIEDSIHARGFTMVHLPAEKLLIQADAFTPGAPNAAPPARPNDNHVNLVDNIERRKLAVDRILPLHGGVVPLSELYRMVGRTPR